MHSVMPRNCLMDNISLLGTFHKVNSEALCVLRLNPQIKQKIFTFSDFHKTFWVLSLLQNSLHVAVVLDILSETNQNIKNPLQTPAPCRGPPCLNEGSDVKTRSAKLPLNESLIECR